MEVGGVTLAYQNRGIRSSPPIKPQIASLRSCISSYVPASNEGNWMRDCPAIVRGFFVAHERSGFLKTLARRR